VLVLLVPGALVLVVCLYLGVRLTWAGRQLDSVTHAERIPVAPQGSVAAKVDARLERARTRVETMVSVEEVQAEDVAPLPGTYRNRAQTYSVLGVSLIGLAAAVAIGALLLI
jgi:hypothetical protein